ncbi:MAG: ATP-binding protein [Blastocatellia bacterium]|nr:ATP-binding protein [Blastocatellia bacterium]
MTPESSPFTPGQPVPIEFFVGRISEVERLRSLVRASSIRGRFKVGFVAGERGIGKSSLASFVRRLSEREDEVAGVHVFLGGASGLQDMVRRAFDRLLKESIDKPWYENIREFFGDHVRKVGLFGASIELNVTAADLGILVDDFVPSLRRLLSKLKGDRKALLLILDDINGLADSAEFANWFKSTVDQIAIENEAFSVCILMVGLGERRHSLIKLQPSLARVFDLIEIHPWTDAETAEFYTKTFKQTAGVSLEDTALQTMIRFTGGLPVIAHEIGDAVWRIADGPVITNSEANAGIIIAAEIIGRKFLEPQIFQAIRSKRYRSILYKLADDPFTSSFQRSTIRKKLTSEEDKVFGNFLKRMRDLGAITSDKESGPGSYRFTNQLHQLYFWLEFLRARKDENAGRQ